MASQGRMPDNVRWIAAEQTSATEINRLTCWITSVERQTSVREINRRPGNRPGTCKLHLKQDRIESDTAARRAFRWVA